MAYSEVKTSLDFPGLEKKILSFWEKNNIFQKSIDTRPENRPFVFYEGPPTANGKPGIHHVISRSIKDSFCRYKTMCGYRVIRKAGWDTHGLPVEIEVEKSLGFNSKDQIEAYGIAEFNAECKKSVFKYLKEWNELTRRIGFWVDLENPYITYTNEYIESVWWILSQMWEKGFLYQGFKILPYCPRCETALSSHETSLGYKEVTERSITAKFPLKDKKNMYILAWTTTPWTLPGNVALAVGDKIDYVEIEQKQKSGVEIYYLAENRLNMIKGDYSIRRKLKGSEMQGWAYQPLFDFVNLADEEHPAYFTALADFVTTDEGTGVVHTAVMYGEDDYHLGTRIGLPAKHTVDEKGRFNEKVELWKGRYVKDPELETEIIRYLTEKGRLYSQDKYTHSYPFCWRCDSPLLYYAKKSWYVKTTKIKNQLIQNNKKINWYPQEVGEGRFGTWLENNVDWALSRDRYWGTPLNIWICPECSKNISISSIQQLKELSGLEQINDLHKPFIDEIHIPCPECSQAMERTPEVLDCWFDSGAMPYGQYHYPYNLESFNSQFPADFISEGVDQTRGWFYSLLAISTIISGKSSYNRCLSIELILDKDGQKMSKSRGNVVDPFQILNLEGADPLRWYLYTVSPPWIPTRFNREGVQEVLRKFYGTLINTYGFFVLYANIDNYTYSDKSVPVEQRPEIDRWLISTMNSLVKRVDKYLSRYDITRTTRSIQDFVIDDLSNWYIRRNRRRFWKDEMSLEKKAAYDTLYEILFTLSKLIAPFSPFLSEEIFRNLNRDGKEPWESVHLTSYPDPATAEYKYINPELEKRMHTAREIVGLCRSARNEAKLKVRQPLANVIVILSEEKKKDVELLTNLILEEVNVHNITFSHDMNEIMIKKARPLFKHLGPKFGSQVNQVAEIIRGFENNQIERLQSGEKIRISLNKTEHHTIELDDVEIVEEPVSCYNIQKEGDIAVALDVRLNEDLVAEGLAREFVNRVQNMRKDSNFNVSDRIVLYFNASPVLKRAIEKKREYIQEEILAVSMTDSKRDGEFVNDCDIEKEKVIICIEKAT